MFAKKLIFQVAFKKMGCFFNKIIKNHDKVTSRHLSIGLSETTFFKLSIDV